MIGLHNYGNNCFINSIIQICRYYPPIIRKLVDVYPQDTVTRELVNVLFQDNEYNKFIDTLPTANVDPYHQGDAHEFYLKMIDKLSAYLQLGKTVSVLTCDCGHTMTNVESLTCLTIHGDIAEGILNYVAPEKVDATCEKCHHTALVKTMVIEPSDMLVVQTNRFVLGDKLTYSVNLGPIVCGGRKWKVAAVCNHYGTYNGGHYTACIHTDNGWTMFNDEQVHKIDNLPTNSDLPYMLFYVPYGEE